MAFTLPLIGDLADLGLNDFQIGPGNARKIRGYVRTNLGAGDALIDTTNQVTLLGDTPITILSDGTWSVDLLDTSSTDLNVEANTLQYELVVEYTSTGSPAKRVYRSGWFALTEADLELVDDVPMAVFSSLDLDLPSVTPSWRSAFVASMEAIATTSAASATSAAASADAAATIVGLTGEDAAVALLIDTPASDTSDALLATIATEGNTTQKWLRGDGVRRTMRAAGDGLTAALDIGFGMTSNYGFHLTASSALGDSSSAVIAIGTDKGLTRGLYGSQKAGGSMLAVDQQPGASAPALAIDGRSAQTATAQLQVHPNNSGILVQIKPDKGFAGGVISAGSTTLTLTGHGLTAADNGKVIKQLAYTGDAGDMPGTILPGTTLTYVDANTLTLSQPAAYAGTALQLQVVGVQPATTQPAFRVYNESDVVIFGVRKSYIEASIPVRSSAVGNIPLTVEGQTAQTASLLKIQREGDATARVEVTAAGLAVTRYGASFNNAGSATTQPVKVTSYATTAVVAMEIQQTVAAPAAGADVLRLTNDASNITSRFDRNGYFMTRKTAAPADADIGSGEMAVWFDSTNGAAKLMVKAKQADGTVRTGSVALA